jgi:hypothetical protein
MSTFYQSLIGIDDATVEQTRGLVWAGMSPRVATAPRLQSLTRTNAGA